MIEYYKGTVFNTDAEAIVNTVNCEGIMGAGIALEFKLRFPDMYADYKANCEKGMYRTGNVYYYKDKDKTIINFPTKGYFKYPSKIEWIEDGLKYFCRTSKEKGIRTVAFPKLGTSNGGLDWERIKMLMEKYLEPIETKVYICLDELPYAEGVEKEMLDIFNNMSIENISSIVKLNRKQKEILSEKMPYNRFWKIGQTETIGIKTYSALFKYYYKTVLTGGEIYEQMSLI